MTNRPHVAPDEAVTLFSYGTLQQPDVQDSVLGRRPAGWTDYLDGYRLTWITVTDPDVIRLSGTETHPILVADPSASVEGTAWSLHGHDITATDAYEVADYIRIFVPLRSGEHAWVYTAAQ